MISKNNILNFKSLKNPILNKVFLVHDRIDRLTLDDVSNVGESHLPNSLSFSTLSIDLNDPLDCDEEDDDSSNIF